MTPRTGSAWARAVVGLLFVAGLASVPAAAVARDPIETWLEAGVRYEIVDDFDVTLSQQVRWDDRFHEVERVIPELSLDYKLFKWLEFGVGYRLIADRRSEGDFRYIHRPMADVTVSHDLGERFEIAWRGRVHEEFYRRRDGERIREPAFRNRITLEFEATKDIAPFVGWELTTPFGELARQNEVHGKWRAAVGVGFDIGKHHNLEPFYLLEQSLEVTPVERAHILGLSYRFDIN